MSGLSKEQTKQNDAQNCCCSALIPLMTKIVEQNNVLIEQSATKEQVIFQLIEQIDGALGDLLEQGCDDDAPVASTYLDMDS